MAGGRGARGRRARRDRRPLDPLRGADRGVRRAAGRLHQRRARSGRRRRRQGRPAVGLELISHAAASAPHPFFAIGGIDASNAAQVVEAGARRLCVVRAIRDAADPAAAAEAAARRLRRGSGRWRPVAEQPRKRKQRGASPTPRERMERGYAKAEERNQEAREALEPLAEGERPLVVTIGAVVAALIALSIVARLPGRAPRSTAKNRSSPQVLAPGAADGDHGLGHVARPLLGRARLPADPRLPHLQRRLRARRAGGDAWPRSLATLGLLAVAGSFFFFMVKAMARIQMPTRDPD